MILWQGLKMASIGAAIGFAAAVPLPRILSAMFQGMNTNYQHTFVVVLFAILLVAMLATCIPAPASFGH
jgi:hypothetical protein